MFIYIDFTIALWYNKVNYCEVNIMALINCPDCGKEISDTARVCINCGCKIKRDHKKAHKVIKITVLSFLICLIVFLVLSTIILNISSDIRTYFLIVDKLEQELFEYNTIKIKPMITQMFIDDESYDLDEDDIRYYIGIEQATTISKKVYVEFQILYQNELVTDSCIILIDNNNKVVNIQYYSMYLLESSSNDTSQLMYYGDIVLAKFGLEYSGVPDDWKSINCNLVYKIYQSPFKYFIFR